MLLGSGDPCSFLEVPVLGSASSALSLNPPKASRGPTVDDINPPLPIIRNIP